MAKRKKTKLQIVNAALRKVGSDRAPTITLIPRPTMDLMRTRPMLKINRELREKREAAQVRKPKGRKHA